jgi:hypothetical protein
MANYVQIELGGVKRGLKFTQATHAEIKAKIGKSNNDAFAFYCIVYAGLVMNNMIKGVDDDFDFETVVDWCDKLNIQDVELITNAYLSTLSFLKEIPEDKKKVVIKKSPAKSTKRNAMK